jgi:far upstream element-binding protein
MTLMVEAVEVSDQPESKHRTLIMKGPNRGVDPRMRSYRRSPSHSPPPTRRDAFRDNYNPYRDERRDDRRGAPGGRDRSYSPGPRDRQGDSFRPSSSRDYGGRGGRSPPGRGEENVEMIQIDSSLVGLIIGRQGENLRRVEQDTGCRVQFITGPDVSGPKRDCKITGPLRARTDAKAEIFRIIEENGRGPGLTNLGRGSGLPPSRDSGSNQPSLRDGEATTQIMVPDRTVGLIIGKGGETIRDLQERSGCHVNIVGEQKSVNGLRPVNLIGSAQAAAMAKNLIMEIVDSDTKSLSNPSGGSRDAPRGNAYGGGGGGDRTSDTITVPSSAVGMIIGKGNSRDSLQKYH